MSDAKTKLCLGMSVYASLSMCVCVGVCERVGIGVGVDVGVDEGGFVGVLVCM